MRDYSVKLFNQGKDFVEISISAKNVIALYKKLAKNYPRGEKFLYSISLP